MGSVLIYKCYRWTSDDSVDSSDPSEASKSIHVPTQERRLNTNNPSVPRQACPRHHPRRTSSPWPTSPRLDTSRDGRLGPARASQTPRSSPPFPCSHSPPHSHSQHCSPSLLRERRNGRTRIERTDIRTSYESKVPIETYDDARDEETSEERLGLRREDSD